MPSGREQSERSPNYWDMTHKEIERTLKWSGNDILNGAKLNGDRLTLTLESGKRQEISLGLEFLKKEKLVNECTKAAKALSETFDPGQYISIVLADIEKRIENGEPLVSYRFSKLRDAVLQEKIQRSAGLIYSFREDRELTDLLTIDIWRNLKAIIPGEDPEVAITPDFNSSGDTISNPINSDISKIRISRIEQGTLTIFDVDLYRDKQ